MKKQIPLTIFTLMLITSLAYAFDYSELNELEVPAEVQRLVGNQKINFFIDEAFSFSLEIKKGIIYSNSEELDKASLEVYVLSSTLERIETSEDIKEDIIEAYKSGEIKIIKKTFMNRIRFFFARFFI